MPWWQQDLVHLNRQYNDILQGKYIQLVPRKMKNTEILLILPQDMSFQQYYYCVYKVIVKKISTFHIVCRFCKLDLHIWLNFKKKSHNHTHVKIDNLFIFTIVRNHYVMSIFWTENVVWNHLWLNSNIFLV